MKKITIFSLALLCLTWASCTQNPADGQGKTTAAPVEQAVDYSMLDTATFAGGCFWCVEASFEQIMGVVEAVSGYTGGDVPNPTYQQITTGKTNHAEAIQIYFDPAFISYKKLLDIFFTAHDPTQLNRQGNDVGTQYRSAIFYHNDKQRQQAEAKIASLGQSGQFSAKIVTELSPLAKFYVAEDYHQDYEQKNPNNPYMRAVSQPKKLKVQKEFSELLKKEGDN